MQPTQLTPDPGTAAKEPLLSVGTVTAFATAAVSLLVAFGLPISSTTQEAILGVVGVAAPIVVAVWGRQKVFAPATVARLLAAARKG